MLCSYASLEGERLEAVKDFEKKTGKTLLAYSCRDIDPDELGDTELSEIKAMEDKLGVVLVAVK